MSEDLTILQGLVKGDPEGYKSEALQQHEYFLAQYEIFKMKPSKDVKQFSLLVKFLSQVSLFSFVSQVYFTTFEFSTLHGSSTVSLHA